MTDERAGEGRSTAPRSYRDPAPRPYATKIVLAGLLSAWIVGMAGALESPIRALEHGHFFNTLTSFLSFVAVPGTFYALGGMIAGVVLAVLVSLLWRRCNVAARSAAAVSGILVIFYWGAMLDEPFLSTAGNVAGHIGMLIASVLAFLLVQRCLARAMAAPSRARRAAIGALVLSVSVLSVATGGVWWTSSRRGAWGVRPVFASGSPDRHLNLLLITIDTLRADHLGCYGYPRERSPRGDGMGTSPSLDALASEGLLFENAVVPEIVTDPSHASIMTSLYPPEHGVMENGQQLDGQFAALAEVLLGAGYSTAAAVSVEHLDGYMSGLSQGFQRYYDRGFHDRFRYHTGWCGMPGWWKDDALAHTRSADVTLRDAGRWLRRESGRPFFLWVHVFEPHMPYESHEDPGDVFTREDTGEFIEPDDGAPARPVRLYDSEIRRADDAVGDLLALLEELGVRDQTVVVAVGDHGEHMHEGHVGRERWFSHSEVYEEVCRVPLVLCPPPAGRGRADALTSGRAVPELVSTLDLGPTLLSLLGVVDSRTGLAGRSLMPLLRGEAWGRPPIVVLANPHSDLDTRALRGERWKLLTRPGGPDELFDLEEDPRELVNLAHQYPSRLDSLKSLLEGATRMWGPVEESRPIDPEVREMLRALGYLN